MPRIVERAGGVFCVFEPDYLDPAIPAGHYTGPFDTRERAQAFVAEIVRRRPESLRRTALTPADAIAEMIRSE
jgi:hypothetical protein